MARKDEDAEIRSRLRAVIADWELLTGHKTSELARAANVSYADLRKWTAPAMDRLPGLRDLARLSTVLGVSERYLLTGEDDLGRRVMRNELAIEALEERLAGLGASVADFLSGKTVDPAAVREQTRAS